VVLGVVEVVGWCRVATDLVAADLVAADLVVADLVAAELVDVDRVEPDLVESGLAFPDLASTGMVDANLTAVDLTGSAFAGAALTRDGTPNCGVETPFNPILLGPALAAQASPNPRRVRRGLAFSSTANWTRGGGKRGVTPSSA